MVKGAGTYYGRGGRMTFPNVDLSTVSNSLGALQSQTPKNHEDSSIPDSSIAGILIDINLEPGKFTYITCG